MAMAKATAAARAINPPICWQGGKRRLRRLIVAMMPPHRCYVEVFGGAAWVLFAKPPSAVEVYNDINGELVNFFKVVKYRWEEFVAACDWLLPSRRLFEEFKRRDPAELGDVERAVRFYYLVKASFGGKGECFGYSVAQRSSFNPSKIYDSVRRAYERLKHVYIENLDFREVIKRYDDERTLFYLDPPYYRAATPRWYDGMADGDYEELAELLRGVRGSFILSINDCEFTRRLFGGFRVFEVRTTYSLCNMRALGGGDGGSGGGCGSFWSATTTRR